MNQIMICVPTYESISTSTFKSIYDLQVPQGFERPDFIPMVGYGCVQARNKAAQLVQEYSYDYLMFVDSDVEVPENTLIELTKADADIAMGVYPRRNDTSGKTEVFLPGNYNFEDENNLNYLDFNHFAIDRVIDIKGGGMGCCLIKTSLLNKMSYPYFRYVEYDNGDTLSEDNYFCWVAKEQFNASIKCCLDVRCGHRFIHMNYGIDVQ